MKTLLFLLRSGALEKKIRSVLRLKKKYPPAPVLKQLVEFPWQDYPDYNCFVCCSRNSSGLQVRFYVTDQDQIACRWTGKQSHENYPGMIHGGLGVSILDELMAQAVFYRAKHLPVSLKLSCTWLRPIKTGEAVTGLAVLSENRDGLYTVDSYLYRGDQKVAIHAQGTYYTPDLRTFSKIAELEGIPAHFHNLFAPRRKNRND